ncbi:heat-inducible transcriptional repressor HrcA [Aquihabitans sp. G128]|uniref:heat-inducible transcriptional repressor HrcA n=1 Tax=Aquihabitans sp. G128 TaxID=2849779 RepID=UPI001C2444F7|nr:heat-inducible transcriptional repressor HrcA [Aquihabitans sp. G128]QXC61551.1 heat-inducible transcriptional repressor HrcA [Aquihabitans sp. G128]
MLDERKASILRAVVEEYIKTAQPVGSGHVVDAPGVSVSSATVRNEMAALETEGFLAQPHTSAGRIPTEKGYRYFVDALAQPSLDRGSAQQVRAFFDRAHGEIEQMLADTTRLLTGLTDYAAVVVGPPNDAGKVRSVQLVSLTPRVALLVAVLANGVVEKRTVELAEDTDEAVLLRAVNALSPAAIGEPFAVLSLVAPSHDPAVEAVLGRVRSVVGQGGADEGDHVFVNGASRISASFEAVETVRSVLTILEQQLVVVSLLRDVVDRGLNVAIGSETGMQPLADCALVVAPYTVDGERVGTVGVLGPTRMNYPQALAAVAVVGQRLGHRLSEG